MNRQTKKIQIGLIEAADQFKSPEGRIWMFSDQDRIINSPRHYQYHFTTKNGLALALVREGDVAFLESKLMGCCGRPKTNVFRRATGEEITQWSR